MRVHWTARAVSDLKSITRYIAKDDPTIARSFADKLKKQAESVVRFPKRGRVVPEFSRDDVRELIEGNYRILYRVRKNMVDILTIFEGHKQFDGFDVQD